MKKASKQKVLFLKEEFADGEGTFKYPNKSKYEGQWKNGQKDGFGVRDIITKIINIYFSCICSMGKTSLAL